MQEGHSCEGINNAVRMKEVPVNFLSKFREWGIAILDGGSASLTIAYCPFCGSKLPNSLRDVWFDRLQTMGLEPGDPAIPEAMRSDRWWREDCPESSL
ncbi:DUF6980 family protein [Mycobacteroides abscessus]|uniref:DUF6980 family protein n=1 Tax=Mycobacteroides abscessus TaxID=36809 RepID=UPI0009D5776C|nr:Uncharacterised protein [Mycobacteroides abscessus subsp. massiliense]SLD04217.1 Uncharacterised protein [Mycobacteroides abscessus subsp. massiliense]